MVSILTYCKDLCSGQCQFVCHQLHIDVLCQGIVTKKKRHKRGENQSILKEKPILY
jgi:hypothetical protein